MNSWATKDRRILLHFSNSTLNTFSKFIQKEDCDCEGGGLLLGSVHGLNMTITEATTPTVWDKRLRYFFERMPFGHELIALARWKASQGTVRYLGEWHTHPEDDPTPSSIDRSEWDALSSKRLDKRPMLAVIVGRKNLYVELVPSLGQGSVMSLII